MWLISNNSIEALPIKNIKAPMLKSVGAFLFVASLQVSKKKSARLIEDRGENRKLNKYPACQTTWRVGFLPV